MTRSLHGFKGNYTVGNLPFSGFYSADVEGFQRDTIVPDGTSGYYFLSRRLVIAGSEDVFMEVEELDRPGTVVYRQQMSRGADCEIDYDRGTLLFRRPVQRVEIDPSGAVLVRRIVTRYQFDSQNGDTSFWGGDCSITCRGISAVRIGLARLTCGKIRGCGILNFTVGISCCLSVRRQIVPVKAVGFPDS